MAESRVAGRGSIPHGKPIGMPGMYKPGPQPAFKPSAPQTRTARKPASPSKLK